MELSEVVTALSQAKRERARYTDHTNPGYIFANLIISMLHCYQMLDNCKHMTQLIPHDRYNGSLKETWQTLFSLVQKEQTDCQQQFVQLQIDWDTDDKIKSKLISHWTILQTHCLALSEKRMQYTALSEIRANLNRLKTQCYLTKKKFEVQMENLRSYYCVVNPLEPSFLFCLTTGCALHNTTLGKIKGALNENDYFVKINHYIIQSLQEQLATSLQTFFQLAQSKGLIDKMGLTQLNNIQKSFSEHFAQDIMTKRANRRLSP